MAATAVVLGARNLGATILDRFLADGWNGVGVARSAETVEHVASRGALGLQADASDPAELERALSAARESFGSVDLVVNATASSSGSGPFGGGPVAEWTPEGFADWTVETAHRCFSFLSVSGRALRANGGGTLVQITGGSARRAIAERGLWSAGAAATRALVQSAALELREHEIHVALLIVDAVIESPKTEAMTRDWPAERLASEEAVADAVAYLAHQTPRSYTHELVITPALERWVP